MSNKRVTITDVAKKAGVSVATASVVVNKKDKYVTPNLRRSVLEAAEALNYQPNLVARSLKVKQTRTIALILTNITSPVTPPFVRIAHTYAKTHGFDTLFAATEENLETEIATVENVLSKLVDGLIICPTDTSRCEHLQRANSQVPVVAIERHVPGIAGVITNNQEISYQAARHLADHGRQRIGLIHMPLLGINTRERYLGVRQALLDTGRYHPTLFKESDYAGVSAFELAVELINTHKVDAIMTTSQSIAMGAFKACKKLGIDVPGQVAIVGYDDTPWMELTTPSLTTTRQPIIEMAQAASELLFRNIESKVRTSDVIVIPSHFVIRNSCGC